MAADPVHSLPESLFSADGVRALDRYLMGDQGLEGFGLMQRAARSAFRQLLRVWPEPGSLLIFCGAGNNGGDGYLIALSAFRQGLAVTCVAVADPYRLSGDAARAYGEACAAGVRVCRWEALSPAQRADCLARAEVIVDALLGTGTRGVPRAPFDEVINAINAAERPVLAVDLPSGLDAATGEVAGAVVRASLTVTFIGLKLGLVTGQGPAVCGRLVFDDLGAAALLRGCDVSPVAQLARWSGVGKRLPVRSAAAHKGRFGHLLIIAGDRGFGGAGVLAAEAAARSGAGLVTLATRPEHVSAMLARCPSVMVKGVTHGNEVQSLVERADVVVCGPGMGQHAWGQQMLQQVLASERPRILDADALNLLSQRAPGAFSRQLLTPHPGEAARLLGCTVAEIEQDRRAAAIRLQALFGGVVLLKGAGTVIADGGDQPVIVEGANPGMATGGMGDVLAGICGALAGQLPDLAEVAVIGASAHLAAAERAGTVKGYMGLLPTDVIECLPEIFAEAERAGRLSPGAAGPGSGETGSLSVETGLSHD